MCFLWVECVNRGRMTTQSVYICVYVEQSVVVVVANLCIPNITLACRTRRKVSSIKFTSWSPCWSLAGALSPNSWSRIRPSYRVLKGLCDNQHIVSIDDTHTCACHFKYFCGTHRITQHRPEITSTNVAASSSNRVPKLVEPHPTKLSSFKRFVRQPTHCVNWWHTYARVPLQILLRHPQDHAAPVWNDFNERGCQLVESCPTRRCKNHSL